MTAGRAAAVSLAVIPATRGNPLFFIPEESAMQMRKIALFAATLFMLLGRLGAIIVERLAALFGDVSWLDRNGCRGSRGAR